MRIPKNGPPITPGEILREEFLAPLGMSQSEVAERLGIPFQRVNQIINGKRAVTPDTALRLGQLFRTTPDFWLNLQLACDLYAAMQAPEAESIWKIKPAIAA